ncbi:MAG: hypothetical protein QXW71_02420 [Thermoplasmata archaeon]
MSMDLEKLLEKLKESVERVEQMRIRLYSISWIDDYNGRPGTERYVYGIKLSRNDSEELLDLITRVLRIVHDDPNIYADFVAVTEDSIYVQWHADAINPYGNPVGTTYRYEKLDDVLRKFKKIESELPENKELLKKLKDLVNNI